MHAGSKDIWALDTNTVLALWLFADPGLNELRATLDTSSLRLATREDALEELRRVLAYRQFTVPLERQAEILARYTARCTAVPPGLEAPPLPPCRDADDQKFLEIARDAGAGYLVTRDKALLRLSRHRLVKPLYSILTPEALQAQWQAGRQADDAIP